MAQSEPHLTDLEYKEAVEFKMSKTIEGLNLVVHREQQPADKPSTMRSSSLRGKDVADKTNCI